jgi:hypothetical protein
MKPLRAISYKTVFPVFLIGVLSIWLSTCGNDPVSSSNNSNDNDSIDTVPVGPRLTIPETSFVFGYAPQNSTISHVFWLHSTGDDTLRVDSIKPG